MPREPIAEVVVFTLEPTVAEVAATRFFMLEPTNVGNYLLLYDDYAKTRKWESVLWLQLHFPHRHLEDKVLLIGGRVDTGLVAHYQPSSEDHVQGAAPQLSHASPSSQPQPTLTTDTGPSSTLQRSPRPIRARSKPCKY